MSITELYGLHELLGKYATSLEDQDRSQEARVAWALAAQIAEDRTKLLDRVHACSHSSGWYMGLQCTKCGDVD